jgi:carbon monoxide dehydrogenase subunit G
VNITDSFTVTAPAETVWALLMDVQRMAECVPGLESIEAVDATTYRGRLKIKLGVISASFTGTVRLTETDPPRRMAALVEADDRSTGSQVRATFSAALAPVEAGTRVDYTMQVNLRGRLAQFGLAVVGPTAKRVTAEFVACLQRKIDAGAPA